MSNQTDELAARLFRAHYTRNAGRDTPVQKLGDMQPGMQDIWRQHALNVQDVLGVEGVAHAMAAMDNVAASRSRGVVERVRNEDEVIVKPLEAAARALGG